MAQFFRAKKTTGKGQVFEVSIESLDHTGRGVAKHQGKVGFIDGALPSEQVKVRVLQQKAKLFEGVIEKVVTASADRVKPFCSHYQECGGCSLQHLEERAQISHKQLAVEKLFAKFAGIQSLPWREAIASESVNYRRAGRIATYLDKSTKSLKLGFRAAKSKKIVEVRACAVLNEVYQEVFSLLRVALNSHSQFKSVSHIQLCEADNFPFILLRHTKPIDEKTKQVLSTQLPWQVLWDDGASEVHYDVLPEYQVDDIRFQFKLSNFIQVNAAVNEAMLLQAMEWLRLKETDKVLDLFCGIGNFSLLMAKRAKQIIGVEGVASSVAMATQNAHTNGIDNAQFFQFDLTQDMVSATWFNTEFNTLVLDPSRTGAYEVLKQLPLEQFDQVLYVSCDPVTLARDSALIVNAGFTLSKIALMNMFPHTGHIETMALFQRR
ncbi:23S rRNA (uracil(1939)-C(5))-methyltransferase RlmD [Pseudoalteromonas luteoviolacea]|uniref:23S rRNA (uracil(1939)-C(5))-methyltransferase RlmD n=1 Tax=Pseudoalteromonas luteoviolacea TaxID=43657 RepID=UPI001B38C720|nr:23S rRNA (uracil(1939)-C(5))-methyltransferase RlmD [Pseudoalteromonas luteoviolacea]MBQ4813966.1 23S rRNA (uracil(1939)-C(5))-methyltransferase RlmD [Pseudoalteromonas luteoviolacea]